MRKYWKNWYSIKSLYSFKTLCLKNYNIISLQPRLQNVLSSLWYLCSSFIFWGFFNQICSHWNREKEVMTTTTYGPSSTGYFVTTQEENPEYRIFTEETVNPNVTVPSYNPGWVFWKQACSSLFKSSIYKGMASIPIQLGKMVFKNMWK